MANYYVDHGAYASPLGNTPTWGVPQEGDGSSKDAATSSAIGSIAFASVPTSGTFSVCGATVSVTGVNGAASVTAAADALAANINATTNTVSAAAAVGTPQLRNLVYARGPSGGAAAGTCEIMMRVGSATLNNATNSNSAITHTFTGSPTVVQFAGGAGGCWGWLLNPAAIGVSSSIALLTYGLLKSVPLVWTATPTNDDTIWVRSGSGKTVSVSSAASVNITRGYTWPLNLVVDSNTVWTGDSGTGVVELAFTATAGSVNIRLSPSNSSTSYNEARLSAVAKGGLKISFATSFASSQLQIGYANPYLGAVIENAEIVDNSTVSSSGIVVANNGGNVTVISFVNCVWKRLTAFSSVYPIISIPSGSGPVVAKFYNCEFEWNITGLTDPGGPVAIVSTAVSANFSVWFESCSFYGWASGNHKFTPVSAINLASGFSNGIKGFVIGFVGCSGLKLPTTYLGLPSAASASFGDPNDYMFIMQSADQDHAMRVENLSGVVEWLPNASPAFPTLAATQIDGVTKWSHHLVWLQSGNNKNGNGLGSPPWTQLNRLAAATRTVTLQVFAKDAVIGGIKPGQFITSLTYIDASTDRLRVVTTSAVPVASAVSWTGAGSYSGYGAYKVTLTTPTTVKQYSEMSVSVRIHGPTPDGSLMDFYVDPEFEIA